MEPIRTDPKLGPLVGEHGKLDVGTADDAFERLVVAIVNQQLSVESAAAAAVAVTPEGILAADEAALADAGLSASKVEYVRNVATAFRNRDLTPAGLSNATDDEAIGALTQVRGVGDWTAKMYLVL
jgi:DNA-3-methyladenine glycosylase II